MKEVLQDTSVWLELLLEGSSVPLGRWPWSPSVPGVGDVVLHEGQDLEVVRVRWSTTDPSTVQAIVRAAPADR